jgi:hypothetical protein
LAILYLVITIKIFSVISAYFLAIIIKSIKLDSSNNSNLETYTYLTKKYKDSIICRYYHVFFLIRRLSIAASIHLLHNYPYIQSSICSFSCFTVLIHMILSRPYKDKVLNMFMILVEICVTVCYSASGCLLFPKLDHDMIIWVILGSIYFSYFLHSALGYYKIFAILYPIIRAWYNRRTTNEEITRNTISPVQQ